MLKNHKVIFQGLGASKRYHDLDSVELAMVTKALYTKQAIITGEQIIVGLDGVDKKDLY